MLILCYRSYMQPWRLHDPLGIFVQRQGGWMSIGPICVDYYIPEDYAYMLYLYDSHIQRQPQLDYLA
jgi:hypothetical protein